jgi:hypothetical protein
MFNIVFTKVDNRHINSVTAFANAYSRFISILSHTGVYNSQPMQPPCV